ncbi:glycosyltransferase family 4 protein [Microbacterium sp. SLBN-146]|uniref:glycosyltransferase family 4 protein n=1 Tax=Microbacterium sp. SLBN-146 TaxID=2768457 RepID=UPI00114E91FA|nr:glycosyltransferase family 4 protein [Microbacterium sp. SLBN-146]TQJ29700.1 glycosyltransferase involved in cell wall biosynthesis [Microbacterium sp. SLBN-146]
MTGEAPTSAQSRRLIIVDHSGAPGGGQLGLARYLAQPSEYERTAIFISGGEIAERVSLAGVETIVLDPQRSHSRMGLLRAIPRLRSTLRAIDDDAIIVSNSGYASLALALSRLPHRRLVAYLRTEPTPPDSHPVKKWFDTTVVYSRFAGYLANSNWTKAAIPPKLAKRPSRVAYPLSGLRASDSAGRRPPLADSSQVRIASFSRLDRWKGLDTLLDAADLLHGDGLLGRELSVDIFGGSHDTDGSYADALRARASSAAYPVTVHGHISDVSPRMREADIVVVPSLHPEPFGQVIAQAISHGCVVIVSDQGGAVEQVTDGHNGLTFRAGDALSLADAIQRVVRTPGLSGSLSTHAAHYGERMSDSALASHFDHAVSDLVSEIGV